MYYGFKQFAYYLRGKEFIVQTDHSNLTYIGDNLTPIVVRWRIFMQSFTFMVQRIPGSKMGLADYLSRMYVEYDPASLLTIEEQQDDVVGLMLLQTIMATELLDNHENQLMEINDILQEEEMKNEMKTQAPVRDTNYYIQQCHGGRRFHGGVKRTWITLNKQFPGHNITHRQVADFVAECPICQKFRESMKDYVEPSVKHLKVDYSRKRLGYDTLTVTPEDEEGNKYLDVMVDLFSHHVQVYPRKLHDALTLARNLFTYFATWGIYDEIITDPGSDIMSEAVTTLNKWLGVKHLVFLVNRHESNGVEGTTNKSFDICVH
jgi:hypothetical protein